MKRILLWFFLACMLLFSACDDSSHPDTTDIPTAEDDNTIATTSVIASDTLLSESRPLESLPDETERTENSVIISAEVQPGSDSEISASAAVSTSLDFAPAEENAISLIAQSLLGISFQDGGESPDVGFDSSGLIYYVLKENGFIRCPRVISEQANMGNIIHSLSELRSGDLVFFSSDGARPEFGGIYIGDGVMIYSPMPGDVVKEQDISTEYWVNAFYWGVRVL